MTIDDEKNLLDILPRFVAEDLLRVPFVNVDSLSVTAMARKFEVIEQRLLNLTNLFQNGYHLLKYVLVLVLILLMLVPVFHLTILTIKQWSTNMENCLVQEGQI